MKLNVNGREREVDVGRQPVGIPHAEFVAAFRVWVAAGAPCPH
jgi:hypothetical protein